MQYNKIMTTYTASEKNVTDCGNDSLGNESAKDTAESDASYECEIDDGDSETSDSTGS